MYTSDSTKCYYLCRITREVSNEVLGILMAREFGFFALLNSVPTVRKYLVGSKCRQI